MMHVSKLEKMIIKGTTTLNIPISVDSKVIEEFMKTVNRESRTTKEQNDLIIYKLTEIADLLRRKKKR